MSLSKTVVESEAAESCNDENNRSINPQDEVTTRDGEKEE